MGRVVSNGGAALIEAQEIRRRIESALPGARVTVRDLTGGADHYEVEVVSERFAGLAPLQRHRLVHAPLKDVLGGDLHALSLRTRTPDET
jgi:stress-induced morphogen